MRVDDGRDLGWDSGLRNRSLRFSRGWTCGGRVSSHFLLISADSVSDSAASPAAVHQEYYIVK